jgi:DNA-directed RNA polymerase subunit F
MPAVNFGAGSPIDGGLSLSQADLVSVPKVFFDRFSNLNHRRPTAGTTIDMTIFKEKIDEEYLTVAETKEILEDLEMERATDDREVRYELSRAIEHVNRFALLDPEESREFVAQLRELDKVDEKTAYKIADLRPRDRDELRALYAQERYSLSGDELDEILNVVDQYA